MVELSGQGKGKEGVAVCRGERSAAPPPPPTVHEDEGSDGQGYVQGQVYATHQEAPQPCKKRKCPDYLLRPSCVWTFMTLPIRPRYLWVCIHLPISPTHA